MSVERVHDCLLVAAVVLAWALGCVHAGLFMVDMARVCHGAG